MKSIALSCLALLGTCLPTSAFALCSGALVQREYREAEWVVRARVVAAIQRHSDNPDRSFRRLWGNGGPVIRYVLRVEQVYKGQPPRRIAFFQERNSGAFYMDRGTKPDIGGVYLLYLARIPAYAGRPEMAKGATYVRHTCGQSKEWREVRLQDLTALRRLAAERR